jgi:hypothetical protein
MMEMENEYKFLEGKNVKIRKKDGFVKVGELISINNVFVVLKFYSGKIEIIPFSEIEKITEIERENKKGENGRI